MNQFSFDRPFSYPDGVSIDAMYGPWDNVSGLVTMVQNDFGFDAPKDGTEFAIKSTSGVKVYVWDSKVTPDANGYTYKEIGGGASAEQLAAKQDKLSEEQLLAVNSGITKPKIATYDGYASSISNLQTGLNAKQSLLNTEQTAAVNSGITQAKVGIYDGYASSIGNLQAGVNAKQAILNDTQMSAVNSGVNQQKVSAYDSHVSSTSNPHNVSKSQIGLGNVDNTSDADKPISTATQKALNGKQSSLSPTQVAAVNSGITDTKVSKYDGYEPQINAMQTAVDSAVSSAGSSATSASNAESFANDSRTYLNELKTAINDLPDAQGVSAQVASNTAKLNLIDKNIDTLSADDNTDGIVIKSESGEVLASISDSASSFKNLKSNGQDVLTSHQSLANYATKTELAAKQDKMFDSKSTDISDGEQVWQNDEGTEDFAKIGEYGIKAKAFLNLDGSQISNTDWYDKVIATYGDSVTEINAGDHTKPYNSADVNDKWGVRIAKYFGMSKHYGRGIGGQCFAWQNGGSAISWVTPTGSPINRNDSFTYDNFDNTSYPIGVTSEMEANGTAIRTRSSSCSWLRITKMFPASIKDNIDVITLMYHNDAVHSEMLAPSLSWVDGSTVDPEWAASTYYSQYGGDYNITSTRGGIASTIMKMQAWMPNAIIVLCTPISGRGTTGIMNKGLDDSSMLQLSGIVKEMGEMMSIPCIDVYATDGINGLNRLKYIADSIHPYLSDGKKMVARAIIGGLKNILPNF